MKALRRALVRLPPLWVALALTLAGCSSGTAVPTPGGAGGASAATTSSASSSPATATTSSASSSPATATTFTIQGYAFPAFSARAGRKIMLVDADAEPHTVTADDGSFDSGGFDGSAPGTLTVPTKPGRYAVHCTVHPTMHGTLTVA